MTDFRTPSLPGSSRQDSPSLAGWGMTVPTRRLGGSVAKKSYWEKLKDPRWQKKRLEALQAADFACQCCYDSKETLHVHHKQYFKGREPWEYEIDQLAVLCETCHSEHHQSEDRLNLICSILDVEGPYSRDSVSSLVAGFVGRGKPEPVDPRSYCVGMFADNVLATYSTGLKLDDLIRLARLSRSHGHEMLMLLLDFSRSNAGTGSAE